MLLLALLACASHVSPASVDAPAPTPHELVPPADARAPATYEVVLHTSAGDVRLAVERALAPLGADHFYALVRSGYYDGVRFDRVMPGFIAQFGFAADPARTAAEAGRPIPVEPVRRTNARGTLAWTNSGLPGSRATVVFVNLADNAFLDAQGQTVFGRVVAGMDLLGALPASCDGLSQQRAQAEGEAYLSAACPGLLVIRHAEIVPPG